MGTTPSGMGSPDGTSWCLPTGVKNLLAGEQQAAVTVAVEALMDGRQTQEADTYAVFDPKVSGWVGGWAPCVQPSWAALWGWVEGEL